MFEWILGLAQRRRRRRRRIAERVLRASLQQTGAYLAIIFALHVSVMMVVEHMAFGDALWLTLTTVTTVGYGDLSATTPGGRLATVVLLYTGGIFVLGKIAGDYFEFRTERRERMLRGRWDWNMNGHILIVNTPAHPADRYLARLVRRFRETREFADTPVQILTDRYPDGLPGPLIDLGDVVHYHGLGSELESLEVAGAREARVIVVLALEEHSPQSDSYTFDVLHRLTELGVSATVVAESVRDENRERLIHAGASAIIRPIRAYPGMLVRAVVAPGTERVIEDMLTATSGDYHRFDVRVRGLRWRDVVKALVDGDLGLPIAYQAPDRSIHSYPRADDAVDADAIICMLSHDASIDDARIAAALEAAG